MKKNYAMRLACLVLMCTLVTMTFVGSTFAKYTSTASGTGTATVAKWDIKLNGTTMTDTVTFDLFATANRFDSDGTSKETDVADNVIAPGTTGKFAMTVQNDSEVNAKYKIALTETNAGNIPLKYSLDGTTYKTLAELNTSLTEQDLLMGAEATDITVYWKWDYYVDDAQDGKDTDLGKAPQTVTVNATITATQVD